MSTTKSASQVPVINTVSFIPLRRVHKMKFVGILPPDPFSLGLVEEISIRFVYCDGTAYNAVENPEHKVLFDAIRQQTDSDSSPSDGSFFRVPNPKELL